MPTSNPLRVLTADDDIRFNAVLDHWTRVGDFHATGYRLAAETLLRPFLDDPEGTVGGRDSVVLSVLFLFRHYLELRFKGIIVNGQMLEGQRAQWRDGHDLEDLWNEAQKLCSAVYGSPGPARFVTIADCVSDLSQIDPASQSFRDAPDRKDRPMFDHLDIGLQTLSATIMSIGDFLDDISMDLSFRVQVRN